MHYSNTPDIQHVEYFKIYNLLDYEFNFKKSETCQENSDRLGEIILDFSNNFSIAPHITKQAFDVEYLSLRSTEPILILYNNKGTDDVYRIYTNVGTPTYKLFLII